MLSVSVNVCKGATEETEGAVLSEAWFLRGARASGGEAQGKGHLPLVGPPTLFSLQMAPFRPRHPGLVPPFPSGPRAQLGQLPVRAASVEIISFL